MVLYERLEPSPITDPRGDRPLFTTFPYTPNPGFSLRVQEPLNRSIRYLAIFLPSSNAIGRPNALVIRRSSCGDISSFAIFELVMTWHVLWHVGYS